MSVVGWRDDSPGLVVVTLDRPPANALGLPLLAGLHEMLDALESRDDLKVVVLESALVGFFAAGADIKHLATIDAEAFLAYGASMRAVNDRIAASAFVSVAAVDGLALGGGLELALACTMRVAGPGARLGLPEVRLGLIPGAGGTQRLPRLVGRGRAIDIMLTARQVGAAEALAIGLVDRVSPDGAMAAARTLASELVSASRPALLAVIRAVDAAGDLSLEGGLAVEVLEEQRLFEDGEAAEGISAFIAKRPPAFR